MLVLIFHGSQQHHHRGPVTVTVDCVWSEVHTGVSFHVTTSKHGNAVTQTFMEEVSLIRYVTFLARTLPGYRVEVCGKMFPERTYVFRPNVDLIADALRIWVDTRYRSEV
jgi:hypothetical protein